MFLLKEGKENYANRSTLTLIFVISLNIIE